MVNGLRVAGDVFARLLEVNAGKQGAMGEIATSVSRRYYVGIASVDGSVSRDESRITTLGAKVG